MNMMCEIDWAILINGIIASAAVFTLFFSVRTYRSNRKFLQKQQFENTFFNMMKQLEDIVSKLEINDKDYDLYNELVESRLDNEPYPELEEINKKGRDVFDYLYNTKYLSIIDKEIVSYCMQFESSYRIAFQNSRIHSDLGDDGGLSPQKIEIKGLKNILYYWGIFIYEYTVDIYLLDHYFRYLYRIMKFVDESDYLETNKKYIDERYKYMGILRATLSPYELVILFYNDLSKYGKEKVKPLIEKYSMFKSLRPELLANTMRDYNLDLIEDDYKDDYDRYIAFDGKDNGYLRYDRSAVSKKENPHLKHIGR